jgi:predicted RNA-binding Zn ribbon-like protein
VTVAWVPAEWLSDRGASPASDLDLAVVLLNSLDLLEDPADRLTDLAWWRDALRQTGHPRLAAAQRRANLPRLRKLRETLRAVFECDSDAEAGALLNPALLDADAVVQLRPDGLGVTGTGPGGDLEARLLAAVAAQVAEQGAARLGVCGSDPCRCAYVDRTRAGTRRYCCTPCNDRAAARAYRRRKAETGS